MRNSLLRKLMIAQRKYDSAIGNVEAILADKIEFDFSIIWQPSDGFVILDVDGHHNAPLARCLDVILLKGKLSLSDYMRETI